MYLKTYIRYMYDKDLALDNLQWSIYHETKPEVTVLNMEHTSAAPCN